MDNKELLREYNNQFMCFVENVDMAIEMLMSREGMVTTKTKVEYDKVYDMVITLYLDEGDIMISLKSDYPYVEELQELFQFYIDTTYSNKQYISLPVDEAMAILEKNTPEGIFNELVRASNEEGGTKFAIGCNDKDMPHLYSIMEYVNNQDGWNAYINDKDILCIEKL